MSSVSVAVIATVISAVGAVPFGVDPTEPFNLYMLQYLDPFSALQMDPFFLNRTAGLVGLRGTPVINNDKRPAASNFTLAPGGGPAFLDTQVAGRTFRSIAPASGREVDFAGKAKAPDQGSFLFFERYDMEAPEPYNLLAYLTSNEQGASQADWRLCPSKAGDFLILTSKLGAVNSPYVRGPCKQPYALQAFPPGTEFPTQAGPS